MDTKDLNEDMDYDTLEQIAHDLMGVFATLANWAAANDPGATPGFNDALNAQAGIIHDVLLRMGVKD